MKIKKGTRIYYHGDVANLPGHGKVTEIIKDKWGCDVNIKLDDGRDIFRLPIHFIKDEFKGHHGTNFVIESAYYEWKKREVKKAQARLKNYAKNE